MIQVTQTAFYDADIPGTRRRIIVGFYLFMMLSLLLAFLISPRFVSAAPEQAVPDIIIDQAIINSPRTTLASLLHLTDTFHQLVHEDGITRDNQERLNILRQQFEKLFDLREIPQKYRQHVATETAVYLREALARFPLPSMQEVPDEDQMITRIGNGKAPLYRVLGTPMVIRIIDTGVYEGRS